MMVMEMEMETCPADFDGLEIEGCCQEFECRDCFSFLLRNPYFGEVPVVYKDARLRIRETPDEPGFDMASLDSVIVHTCEMSCRLSDMICEWTEETPKVWSTDLDFSALSGAINGVLISARSRSKRVYLESAPMFVQEAVLYFAAMDLVVAFPPAGVPFALVNYVDRDIFFVRGHGVSLQLDVHTSTVYGCDEDNIHESFALSVVTDDGVCVRYGTSEGAAGLGYKKLECSVAEIINMTPRFHAGYDLHSGNCKFPNLPFVTSTAITNADCLSLQISTKFWLSVSPE